MDDDLLRLAHGALSPNRVDSLLTEHGSAGRVLAAIARGSARVPAGVAAAVGVAATERRRELGLLGVRFVPAGRDGFPGRLLLREAAPRWLFMRGEVREGPTIAIVGTRSCTRYGETIARAYGETAAAAGWSVVSGLAKGIDAAAHRGALAAGGHTHAVLGSGIDVVYPRRHRVLHDEVLATGGSVSSEFPPGTRPDGWRFPTRNRIIAGSADVVLVVEAGSSGGALITAQIALDFGVPVWATPGDVDRAASVGTNLLIRDGAFPVFGPDDLGMALDLLSPIVDHR